ncbi:dipeptidase [Salisaeta longa]|uniref:dipeptidase n=1 Tax=Salisaeta longa TaxID=503170 RepID=UPI000A058446|nr:dipeptidase [Salisaeta longa]
MRTALLLWIVVLPMLPPRAWAQPVAAMQDGGAVALPAHLRQQLIARDSLWATALRIHYRALVLDGHLDTPTRMHDENYRFAQRHTAYRAHVDRPRMADGGLDAAFFAAYVAPYYGNGARAVGRARAVLRTIKQQVRAVPTRAALATTAADVRRIARSGRTAVLLGLEGGHALAGSVDTLRAFARAGIRYVTLTHINTNGWADSAQDAPRHGGLNARGVRMVQAMNDLGVLVDLAHASDATFYDALRASRAPVLVSHSACRRLVPTARNVSDDQLRALARNGGVLMINFFDALVNPALTADVFAAARARLKRQGRSLAYLWDAVYAIKRERNLPGATLRDVVDHIDHAVRVAGIDHVGLGSDFDGVFDLPRGLDDVTRLPWITYALLKRGYAARDIYKILGGNALRVLRQAERLSIRGLTETVPLAPPTSIRPHR